MLQLVKKYERGDLPKNDWLDKLAFRRMEEIHAVSSLGTCLSGCSKTFHRQKQRNPSISSFTLTYPVSISLSCLVSRYVLLLNSTRLLYL